MHHALWSRGYGGRAGPLPVAAPLAKEEGELFADCWIGFIANSVVRLFRKKVRAD